MSYYPRLLILSDFEPDVATGGPALMRGILNNYPADRMLWFVLSPSRKKNYWWRPEVKRTCSFLKLPKRGMRINLFRRFWELFDYKITTIFSSIKAAQKANEFHAEIVWAILDYNALRSIKYFILL